MSVQVEPGGHPEHLSINNPVLTVQDSASHFGTQIRRTMLNPVLVGQDQDTQYNVKQPLNSKVVFGQVL